MLSLIRSPWFSLALTALLVAFGSLLPEQKGWLFGLAATAAFCGIIDWISGNRDVR